MALQALLEVGRWHSPRRDAPLEPRASTVLRAWLRARARLLGPAQLMQGFVEQLEREFDTRIAHRGANLLRSSVVAQWLQMGRSRSLRRR